MKRTFIIYADYEDKIDMLDDIQKGKLLKALFALNRGEDLSDTLDAAGKMAFCFIKDQMKRDSDSYEEIKRARSEAGKKGMESRWKTAESTKNSSEDKSALSYIIPEDVITNDNKVITKHNKITNVNFVKNENNKNNLNVDVDVNDNVYIKDDDDKERINKKEKINLSSSTSSSIIENSNFKIFIDELLAVDLNSPEFICAVKESKWLRNLKCLDASWLNKNYKKICAGYFSDYITKNDQPTFKGRKYSKEELALLYDNLDEEVERET